MKSIVGFLLAAALLAGCGSSSSSSSESSGAASPSSDKKLSIAVIPKGTTHVFWKAVEAGAQEAGKELGVEVIWKGPLREDNKDEQIKVVQDFITKGVSGIALAPLDENALRTPVTEAQAASIPVVIFDSGLAEVQTTSYIATDNTAAGGMGGKRLGELLGGKGKVLMLRYQEGSASTDQREKGFLDEMAKLKGIEVVSSNQYAGPTAETAQKAAESLVNRFKKGEAFAVDGIFCPNESTAFGMLRALQNAGLAGKVKLVGFDSSPPLIDGLKAGEIDALVVQDPRKMGYLSVQTLVKHIRGEKVESKIDTGAVLVDKANLATPEIEKLLK